MAFMVGRCLRCGKKLYKDSEAYICESCRILICDICNKKVRSVCPICRKPLSELTFSLIKIIAV